MTHRKWTNSSAFWAFVFVPAVTAAVLLLASGLVSGCREDKEAAVPPPDRVQNQENSSMKIVREPFGKTGQDEPVDIYTLTNQNGMTVKIINYGGIVTHISVPGKNSEMIDVALGFNSLEPYLGDHPYFGALVGRYANRIAQGKFTLDGITYSLAKNNGNNHLHGGIKGFDKVVWQAQEIQETSANAAIAGLKLSYTSKDGEEGYPGKLSLTVVYTLSNNNELAIDYEAQTDKPTPINLTQHSYFNLEGAGSGDILGHILQLHAGHFTPVNDELIPTGVIQPVDGTPMDFREPQAIGARINQVQGGYDHNFVLSAADGTLQRAAAVTAPVSGITMEVLTTQPGIQLYTGNFLDGSITGKGGKQYRKYYGFCLETQHFPDSPNHSNFPSTILQPGQTYRHRTVYRFSLKQ